MSDAITPANSAPTPPPDCDRAFVRIAEGQLHYRHAGPADSTGEPATGATPAGGGRTGHAGSVANPIWLMHASPASSASVEPLALELARRHGRRVFAPDTPGNGDSAPLREADPTLRDYADAFVRALDALRLERVDLYGYHTGAHIAIELALAHPQRVGSLVLDGLLWLEEAERADYLAHYAPLLTPDAHGTQVFTALQFIRDQAWFFPHFRRDAAHNLGGGAMPPALLHALTVELLKAAPSYHLAYRAVFRHRLEERLPALAARRVLLMADAADPTRHAIARARALLPDARSTVLDDTWSPQGLATKARAIVEFVAD